MLLLLLQAPGQTGRTGRGSESETYKHVNYVKITNVPVTCDGEQTTPSRPWEEGTPVHFIHNGAMTPRATS
ncbi:hypothetical protein E2C01_057381 [Portunus trituberculatus]|uniref:Uncharacterized protein n=1 Tax=Portunus trituberculatus TaxID=210409 RepID=A0A5B7H0W9_PORTR|nr:hypothetical protein [Portunus trituberculatus]